MPQEELLHVKKEIKTKKEKEMEKKERGKDMLSLCRSGFATGFLYSPGVCLHPGS